ncbi:Galactosylgalactosylxylosylprotein 3-beta-glucuronosyltransferase [Caenorhabditis elegans]|uniref:Galactosylgalactosylxylosylprotein 3-beta-glucuronosyltransferase n=1 Tax=Caenorhabditis elegans TaxID=6239 RepID=O02304_CAEEL|nr:Galactosylgalactosylxylosylprotein 3-beta-glucuronosyltransferase [Caenorhabditis elegans]CAB03531.2 Galactosylgalactosylxylosylprotein 3-beta-glucuronosyltransferase [Caenorhabditis elegans]|eukprot:NP_493121.2 Galactosylgalactosylxylosylprotein 3-beta-glucuronosyltransferase [Caenorhabditis elegans]
MKKYQTLGIRVFFLAMFLFIVSKIVAELEQVGGFEVEDRTIIVITPTYRRINRMPDITRLSNTLSHVKNLHWIVIEDGVSTVPAVRAVLERTGLSYTYMAHKTAQGYPAKGWYQRTMALKFIRENTSRILNTDLREGVVYFADDDNSYDLRLFNDFIRNVRKLGVWAVGFAGGAAVEAPKVVDKKVTSFDALWVSKRLFAVDMAGFAVNLKWILRTNAVFGKTCNRGDGAPETCLLEDLGFDLEDIEPFGYEKQNNREILVWHTRTSYPKLQGTDTFGYFVEN